MFRGGYVLLSREILTGDYYSFTPCTREVFMYLLLKVNYIDGKRFKRGSQFFQLTRIREDLAWSKGFVKQSYTEDQMKTALNTLVKHDMITCAKTARGIHVTICNYDSYQNPDNYEYRHEARMNPAMKPDTQPPMKAPLKQKKEEVIINKKKQTNKSSNSLNENGKDRKEVGNVKELQTRREIDEIMEITKRFLPVQTAEHRVYIAKHLRNHGADVVKRACELYWKLFSTGKIEKPVNNPVYFYNDGIYGWINRVLQETQKVEPKIIKRYCIKHGEMEFESDKIPQNCPKCGDILYGKLEYNSVLNSLNPKTEPQVVEDSSSDERKEFLEALDKLGESMRMQ